MQIRRELISIALYLALAYAVASAAYEIALGSTAAAVVADKYDYSVKIPNSTYAVSIDSLPRNVYKTTKEIAGIFIGLPLCTFLTALATVGIALLKTRTWHPSELAVAVASAFASVVPFCYAAFGTWKYESLSRDDVDTWNAVDPRFMQVLSQMYKVVVITAIPTAGWVTLLVLLAIS